ncbi:MAG TPA: hypothetical protein P5120_05725 [Spirochaetota bacterium]|nr:hypothetical protein [Spirochaetota bacterium]HRX46998.1 hypothetical protein [Spirochaetota bacterium]
MKPVTVVLFTIATIAVFILFGNYYTVFHISKKTCIIITSIVIAAFLVKYIADMFKPEKSDS